MKQSLAEKRWDPQGPSHSPLYSNKDLSQMPQEPAPSELEQEIRERQEIGLINPEKTPGSSI